MERISPELRLEIELRGEQLSAELIELESHSPDHLAPLGEKLKYMAQAAGVNAQLMFLHRVLHDPSALAE